MSHPTDADALGQRDAGSKPVQSIHVRVQHHPSRVGLLPRLLDRLDGSAEVVSDPDPNDRWPSPWRTYRECLSAPPAGATHLLILQDDAVPCRNLVAVCERLACEIPVCLFTAGAPVRLAQRATVAARKGERFVAVGVSGAEWVPVVAVLWPVELADALLVWAGSNRLPGDPRPRSDDAVVGRWARQTAQEVIATVPSLVQHPDDEVSLIGRKARYGRSAWRVAHSWIGEEIDPLSIDWKRD